MKTLIQTALGLFLAASAFAQTNTFPTNGSVGIGTTSPTYKLDVVGPEGTWKARFQGPDGYITIGPSNSGWAHIYTDRPNFIFNQGIWTTTGVFSSYNNSDLILKTNGTTRLTISKPTGYVGIGTSAPAGLLEIKGPDTGTGTSQVIINSTDSNAELGFSLNGSSKGYVWYEPTNDLMGFGRGGFSNSIFVNAAGNLAVGTWNPTEKLTVNGTIYGKEVKVDLSVPAPDYVFAKDYNLPSLDELKTFIDRYNHLPEVPSAKEMEQNGINLGEMNMILLKKMEEMTLYMIEQKKQLEEQAREIQLLKMQIH